MIAEEARLQAADGEFLIVVENDREQSAWHPNNAPDRIDVDDRTTAQAHEPGSIEADGKIAQPIGNSMSLVGSRAQVKNFAVGDDGNNL